MQLHIQKKSKDTDPTLAYYDQNASNFIKTTQSVDFHEIQDLFLLYLPENASILDLGCGSGRDAKYFKEQGYKVTASDGSKMLCKAAEESILKLTNQIEGLEMEKMWLTEDARKDRKDEKWLNIILRKTDR